MNCIANDYKGRFPVSYREAAFSVFARSMSRAAVVVPLCESPLKGTIGTSILGSTSFVEEITTAHLQGKKDGNIPALRQFTSLPTVEEIVKEVQTGFADNEKLARRASMYLCHKHSGLRLGEIGESFNVRDTAISEASRRFAKELETDGKLREVVARIKDKLKICGM